MYTNESIQMYGSPYNQEQADYVTIYECASIPDLDLVKLALNHAEIPFRVQHENALRMGNIPAIGFHGALIQVEADDAKEAREMLLEQGFKLEITHPSNAFFSWLDNKTSSLPLLNRWPVVFRFLFLAALLIFTVYLVLVFTVDPFI
ncbi:MAG: hypothetical protein KDC57_09870 [Saprospiraceae bacterium]|nr:hypothetical protein [Saprospiraceae bacterium]